MAKRKRSPAVRFLWIVFWLTMLFIAGAIGYRLFEKQLMRWALVPSVDFREVPLPRRRVLCAGAAVDRAAGHRRQSRRCGRPPASRPTQAPRASVFFVHPTSFLESRAWNAPLDDRESQERARAVRAQPGERVQFGRRGLGAANTGRRRSAPSSPTTTMRGARSISPIATCSPPMRQFLRQAPADRPIILAAHSQGSLHLMRLLAGADPGRARGGADRRRLSDRLAGLGHRRPAGPAPPRLRAARIRRAACSPGRAMPSPPIRASSTDVYDETIGPRGVARRGTDDALHQPADRRARRRRGGRRAQSRHA